MCFAIISHNSFRYPTASNRDRTLPATFIGLTAVCKCQIFAVKIIFSVLKPNVRIGQLNSNLALQT